MIRRALLLAIVTVAAAPPGARADYAVLKSGVRLHITGYQIQGDRTLLTIAGGVVNVAAADLSAIQPEDVFTEAAPPASAGSSEPFAHLIRAAAAKHGLDEKLITIVIATESNFNPRAVSRKSALGLMQLLPETAARYSVSDAFDPAQNIEAGTHYLKDLLNRYRGNLRLALAAYNAGPETVDRYGGVPPIAETRSYVRRVTAILGQEKDAGR